MTQEKQDARKAGAKRYFDLRRSRVFVERQNEKLAWCNQIDSLSDRELLIAGAVAYWAEGRKAKPWRTSEVVVFVNSDAAMIRLFLRFLTLLDVEQDRLRFQLHIHRSADVAAANQFWSEALGVSSDRFLPTVLKQHSVKTNRKNTGIDYHGCLSVRVLQSAPLYRHIEGIWWAVRRSAAVEASVPQEQHLAPAPSPDPGAECGIPPPLLRFRRILQLRRGRSGTV